MCLIIANPSGILPPDEYIINGFENNGDGWGVMWTDGLRIHVEKGFDLQTLLPAVDALAGHPYVIHFRFATHGLRSRDNLHPFKLTKRLYMAHNGILDVPELDHTKSDTWHFAQLLKPVLAKDPSLLQSDHFLSYLGKTIGSGNKLAFLDVQGRVSIVNRERGVTEDGIWYSNSYSLYASSWVSYRDSDWDKKNTTASVGAAASTTAPSTLEPKQRIEFVCDVCGDSDVAEEMYELAAGKYMCWYCFREASDDDLKEMEANGNNDVMVECIYCNGWDYSRTMVEIGQEMYGCRECDREVGYSRKDVITDCGEGICDDCGYRGAEKRRHPASEARPILCDTCAQYFYSALGMKTKTSGEGV